MAEAKLVVIVDDDEAVRASTAALLGLSGYRMLAFAGCREMLDAILPAAPDCLLIDPASETCLDVPELSSALAEKGWAPVLIALTGHAGAETASAAARLGAVAVIEKPYQAQSLLGAVARFLARADPDPPLAKPQIRAS